MVDYLLGVFSPHLAFSNLALSGPFQTATQETLFKTYNAFHTSCVNMFLHGAVARVTSTKILEWFYIYGIRFTNNTLLAECLVQMHNSCTFSIINST